MHKHTITVVVHLMLFNVNRVSLLVTDDGPTTCIVMCHFRVYCKEMCCIESVRHH